jgi:hypothetical protein
MSATKPIPPQPAARYAAITADVQAMINAAPTSERHSAPYLIARSAFILLWNEHPASARRLSRQLADEIARLTERD